ncbi:reverse transcriptase [Gossypium australe]|uniref:Reverse transcriptase n=1 Tax=Gossypium australe TaxID=47621 RepID=A0A5B6VEW0_9ROSI|nr:reverse transcriptase [Gossypium australe]
MEAFRNTLEDCRLIDVGYTGNWFTWKRGNLPEMNIRERLDRGVANVNWMSMFPEASIQHVVHSTSDHYPFLITTNKEGKKRRCETFKFEAWWIMEETFESKVKLIWDSSSGDLLQKLEYLKAELKKWAVRVGLSRKRKKELLTSKLAILMEAKRADDNLAELIDTKLQLNFEIDKYESYWEQRARVNWLKLGDRNTAFFHSIATQKRRQNCIQKLQDTDGREIGEQQEMAEMARTYFQELFKAEEEGQYEHLLSGVEPCISKENNRLFTMPYVKEEIWEALTSMGATKALGEDRLPAIFFQKLWHIFGNEVSTYCFQQLNSDMEVCRMNTTHIVLIPKKVHPTNLSHFHPISLCNFIYKIMAKAIANHFRVVLEKCIDKAQSAFVPGRLISDNVLVAYEILNTLKKKRIWKKGLLAIKLDMSKAYDRVEWTFLKEMMRKMGFEPNWVNLIMKCISTVSYVVVLNGQAGNIFYPSRGLRQGDPLSPFLFLIFGEGLSSLMRLVQREENFRGVKASRRGP